MDFTWNKSFGFDLKKMFNAYSVGTVAELASFVSSPRKQDYDFYQEKIKTIVHSWNRHPYGKSPESLSDICPQHFLDGLQKSLKGIIGDGGRFLQEKPFWEPYRAFYEKADYLNVLHRIPDKIKTINGVQEVQFDYAQNFRFKIKSGLNLLNCLPQERIILIPQNENEFLWTTDFKSFEFRTYLKLIDFSVDFNQMNLYEHFAEMNNFQSKNPKQDIISFLYGKQNEELEKILHKESILNGIKDGFYHFENKVVLIDERKPQYKLVHSIVQTISQYYLLEKLNKVLDFLKDEKSSFVYPVHDELIFSIDKDEMNEVVPRIRDILIDDTYKISEYCSSKNLWEKRELKWI